MSNTTEKKIDIQLDKRMQKEISPAILKKVSELDSLEQEMFLKEFKKKRKSPHIYFWCALLGVHYLYLGKIGLFFLFLLTLGGIWIWYLIDIFRGVPACRVANEDAALEAFKSVKYLS